MKLVHDALATVRLGTPQVHRNLAVFPLLAERHQPPGYVLLDEALERKLARVTEVSEAGRVPELAFENASAEKILLIDGDELAGAKQNRVVNLSILVGAGQRLVIPVSCVEQGRWSYRRSEARHDFQGRSFQVAHPRLERARHLAEPMASAGARSRAVAGVLAAHDGREEPTNRTSRARRADGSRTTAAGLRVRAPHEKQDEHHKKQSVQRSLEKRLTALQPHAHVAARS
jgi:hypothetical protein